MDHKKNSGYVRENERAKNDLIKKLKSKIKSLEKKNKVLKSERDTLQRAFDDTIKKVSDLQEHPCEITPIEIEKETTHTNKCYYIPVGEMKPRSPGKSGYFTGARYKWVCNKNCPIKNGGDNDE